MKDIYVLFWATMQLPPMNRSKTQLMFCGLPSPTTKERALLQRQRSSTLRLRANNVNHVGGARNNSRTATTFLEWNGVRLIRL